jgi:histidyl-tRNA synthetase
MEYETLKGTSDTLPEKQIRVNEVLDIIKTQFEKYGFRPFDTPIIEYFETLANKYEEDAEIVQEIFQLKDRGDRNLGLRYDLTVPLCRFISSQKQLKKPFRRYQIGKVFRDGPVKSGRAREFVQCDGDVIGLEGREIEAELMILFYETYSKLKINSVIELNNNKILRGAFLQQDFKEKELESLILSVDKLKKIGEDAVLDEIKQKGFDKKKATKSLQILQSKSFKEIKELAKNQTLIEGIEELEALTSLIEQSVDFRINFSMARGLNIYTGNIWEVYDKEEKIKSSLGSGGRYDNVISQFQNSKEITPAVGISFGLVPILECIKESDDKKTPTDILLVPLNKDCVKTCFKLSSKLRKNKNIEIYYSYKIKQAFSYAEYLKIKEIAFIGPKDIENKKYKLKNIQTGEEKEYNL